MLSIGAHAVRRAQIVPGENALVIGLGPIGLGAALFAKQAGARVIVSDVSDWRLAFAQEHLGIEDSIDAKGKPLELLQALIPGDLPTVVLDATGNSKSMHQSFQFTAHGGKLVFVGLFTGDVTFHDPDFHRRELTLMASRNSTIMDFQNVLQLLESGQVDITSWITRHASPEATVVEFADWVKPESHIIKAMLTF
jgi:2-desacetyl-2-hydroxyethyl bacteriochlorophyllide A dehydrogenase